MSILVVEDEARLAAALAAGLGAEGYEVEVAGTAAAALARVSARTVRALVLDLGLPDADGTTVIAAIRAAGRDVPILVLTARDALTARVGALDAGADDYLIKPFEFAELLARLRAVLRRAEPATRILRIGDVEVRPGDPQVAAGDRSVTLSPRERALLELLMVRATQIVARRDILKHAFGYDFDPGTNIVEVHLGHLRRKLAGAQLRIETVRGFGYRLTAAA